MSVTVLYAGTRQIFDVDPPADASRSRAVAAGPAPSSLARFLWLEHDLPARPLCGGTGWCGRCRVRFLSPAPTVTAAEHALLSTEELADGIRLACRHTVTDGIILEIPESGLRPPNSDVDAPPTPGRTLPERVTARRFPARPLSEGARLAVDLGTTSLAWRAEDAAGRILAEDQEPNPQMSAGSDVMARLAEAARPDGAAWLQTRVKNALMAIVSRLAARGQAPIVVELAANPAMSALLLGLDTGCLAGAPYRLPSGLEHAEEGEWHLPGLPPLRLPPHPGPFVGGDVGAGLATLLEAPRPFLLADLGTNGEFVLAPAPRQGEEPRLLAASVPLGPALEGVGLRCGGLAGPGGITAFVPGPDGLRAVTPNGDVPRHICGTGYLSLLRCLLDIGLVDKEGRFVATAPPTPGPLEFLRRRLASALTASAATVEAKGATEPTGWKLPLPGGLFLTGSDVESLMTVKAAFSLAIERLLAEAGLPSGQRPHLYLAGALGQHAPLDALEELGFLPAGLAGRCTAIGNASLKGAALLLRHPDLTARLAHAVRSCRLLDLASEPHFHQDFIRHMRLGRVPARPRPL